MRPCICCVDRERQILAFVPQDYWSVWVEYAEGFKAFYRRTLAPQAAIKRKDASTSASEGAKELNEGERVSSQAEADRLVAIAKSNPHQVMSVEGKTKEQNPPPPFITSSLQQAAGVKLKFAPDKTMKVAQSLYESGHITYMRTDSVVLAAPVQAVSARLFGPARSDKFTEAGSSPSFRQRGAGSARGYSANGCNLYACGGSK